MRLPANNQRPMTNLLKLLNLKLLALLLCVSASIIAPSATFAGEADVVKVSIAKAGSGKFRIDVTLEHADTGWDHYANKWDVFDADGNLLGTRVLHHPHVNEQPFTRSLTLSIPETVKTVTIRGGG